ncbi:MAG: aminoglycoside 3'-phosphotransferase [Erysipelotrichaceae bacterium]|nr:aminoglycoside 3'-phosphotransferase [Erysipelotrichaceae bacterium]
MNNIPDSIKKIIAGKSYKLDNIGMSGSKIIVFDDMVLKIEKYSENFLKTIEVMEWLNNKIPVPKVICYEIKDDYGYLLMSKITGNMACDEFFLENPNELLKLLASAFRMLWKLDISDCPRIRDINTELCEAKYRVENDLVDLDNVEPETFGINGFENPMKLLKWLEENKPSYEPVFSHGDFCLPNIFIEREKISGFIDLGDAGVGDKWRDIALCYRSLKNNFNGTYGNKKYLDFDPNLLFEYLDIEPDYNKLKYYLLLDELF